MRTVLVLGLLVLLSGCGLAISPFDLPPVQIGNAINSAPDEAPIVHGPTGYVRSPVSLGGQARAAQVLITYEGASN